MTNVFTLGPQCVLKEALFDGKAGEEMHFACIDHDACKPTHSTPPGLAEVSDLVTMVTWVRAEFNIHCRGNEMHKKVLFSKAVQREVNSGDFAIYRLCWTFLHISPFLSFSLSLSEILHPVSAGVFFGFIFLAFPATCGLHSPPKLSSPANPFLPLPLLFSRHISSSPLTDTLQSTWGVGGVCAGVCGRWATRVYEQEQWLLSFSSFFLLLFFFSCFCSAVQLDSCGAPDRCHPEHQDGAVHRHEQRGLPLHIGTAAALPVRSQPCLDAFKIWTAVAVACDSDTSILSAVLWTHTHVRKWKKSKLSKFGDASLVLKLSDVAGAVR